MVSGGITKDGMSKSKVDPCWVCGLRVKANSVLCVHHGKLIHGRCEKGDCNVFREHCLQKMIREYWRDSGAGIKVM